MPQILKPDIQKQMIEKFKDIYPITTSLLESDTSNITDWLQEIDDNIIKDYSEHEIFISKKKKDKLKDEDLLQCALYLEQLNSQSGLKEAQLKKHMEKLLMMIVLQYFKQLGIVESSKIEDWNINAEGWSKLCDNVKIIEE
jgi:hypothetical protein